MRYDSLRQGLVGAWCPSLGATGYRLLDRSGYGNHGTLTNMDAGTDWVGRQYGTTLDFDGVNDYVLLQAREPVTIKGSMTISGWMNYRGGSFVFNPLLASWNAAGNIGYGLSIGTNRMRFDAWNVVAGVLNGSTTLATNRWYYTACTLQNDRTAVIYLNGFADTAPTVIDSLPGTLITNQPRIGDDSSSGGRSWNGFLDDIRLYNRALTPAEIRLLASEPGIGLRPERVSVYFGESLSSRRRKILTGLT